MTDDERILMGRLAYGIWYAECFFRESAHGTHQSIADDFRDWLAGDLAPWLEEHHHRRWGVPPHETYCPLCEARGVRPPPP